MPSATSYPSPTSPTGWQTYSDSQFAFKVAYPPAFTFKQEGTAPYPRAGWLIEYRAVDTAYLNAYPPGQVEIGIYAMDSDTLESWIAKHTGPSSPSAQTSYWQARSNIAATVVPGRSAASFDYTVDGFPVAAHAVAFLLSASRMVVLDWWATDASYTSSIQLIAGQMLASFNG